MILKGKHRVILKIEESFLWQTILKFNSLFGVFFNMEVLMILSGYSSLINEITTESFFERSNLKGGRFMPVGTTLLDSQASTMLLYDNQQQSQEKYKMCA